MFSIYLARSLIAGKLDSPNLFTQLYMFLNQPLQGNKTARELDFWSCVVGFLRLLDFWKLSGGMHYYDLGGDLAEYLKESKDTKWNVSSIQVVVLSGSWLWTSLGGCALPWRIHLKFSNSQLGDQHCHCNKCYQCFHCKSLFLGV